MPYRNAVGTLAALDAALREDEDAKSDAMQGGLDASLPLKPRRLQQLCVLGERMLATGRSVQRARLDVDLALLWRNAR